MLAFLPPPRQFGPAAGAMSPDTPKGHVFLTNGDVRIEGTDDLPVAMKSYQLEVANTGARF